MLTPEELRSRTSKSRADALFTQFTCFTSTKVHILTPEELRARHVDVQVSSRLSLAREYQGAQAHGTSVSLLWFKKKRRSEKKARVPNLVGIFFFAGGNFFLNLFFAGANAWGLAPKLLVYFCRMSMNYFCSGVFCILAILDLIFFQWWIAGAQEAVVAAPQIQKSQRCRQDRRKGRKGRKGW